MDNSVRTRRYSMRAPLLAVVLASALVAAPLPAKAEHGGHWGGRGALAVFGGAVLLTSLVNAVTYRPPQQVVYQTAAPVVYYPYYPQQRVVYRTVAPVAYYPQTVVYQTVPGY